MLSDALFPFERTPLGVFCDQNRQAPHEIAPFTFYERTAALAPDQAEPANWPGTIQVPFCAHNDADQREIVQHGPYPIVLYRVAKDARDARLASLRNKQVCWVVVEGSKIHNDWDGQLITQEKAAEIRKLKGGEQDGPWSKPDTPARWARKFKICSQTFKRHVKAGKIRVKVLSDRSYQVHLDDVPQEETSRAPDHK